MGQPCPRRIGPPAEPVVWRTRNDADNPLPHLPALATGPASMTANDFFIRPLTPDDLPALVQLSRQTFTEAFGPQNKPENLDTYVSAAFSEAQLGEEVRDPRARFFLALAETTPVGYAKLRQGNPPPELERYRAIEIQRIYALASAKGRGVGKSLMRSCLDAARSEGYQVVWLGVWEHNPRAIAFYRQWGFEAFGAYPFPFGDEIQTDLLFQLSITNEQ